MTDLSGVATEDLMKAAGLSAPTASSAAPDLSSIPTHVLMNILSEADINAAKAGVSAPNPKTDPFFAEKRVLRGVGRGLQDIPDAGAQLLARGVEAIAPAGSSFEQTARTMRQNVDRNLTAENDAYAAQRAASGGSGFDAGRLTGNVLGTAPLAMALPAASGPLVGALTGGASGALGGALQPVYNVPESGAGFAAEKGKQTGLGAAGGAVIGGALGALSRVISPKASTNPQVQMLRRAGAELTPGETLGGKYKLAEDALTSSPLTGSSIQNAQQRSLETANRGAVNRALAPIGEKVSPTTEAGYRTIAEAGDKINAAYKDVLPRVSARVDPQFATDLNKALATAFEAPKPQIDQFKKLLDQKLANQIDGTGQMTGEGWKQAQSELGRLGRQYLSSADADQKTLGAALMQARGAVTDLMMRQNPGEAAKIKAIDEAFKRFLPVEQAAQTRGANEGVFTGAQLRGAVHNLDNSLRNGAFARGRAPMQDYADAFKSVTGRKVPDSGTPTRALFATGIPGVASAMLTAPLMPFYARPVQNTVTALLASRPAAAAPIAGALQRVSPLLASQAPAAQQFLPQFTGLLGP